MRDRDEVQLELASLDSAHQQNEAQRDAFIGLGHTALFAASISFVSDLFPLGDAKLLWLVIMSWFSSVLGLLAFTLSFSESRKAIDARRIALHDEKPPQAAWLETLNAVSLWTFPASLLSLFIFASVNLVNLDEQRRSSITTEQQPGPRNLRSDASPATSSLQPPSTTGNRRSASPESSDPPPAAAAK